MEYQWMFDGAASEDTQRRRSEMIELIEAVMDSDQSGQVLQWRIEAKQAFAALMTRATFNDDAEDAAWALETAEARIADCGSMLLS